MTQVASSEKPRLAYLDKLPPVLDRDLLFDDPEITGGQISPNGKWISFLKPYQGTINIWVKGSDEPFSAARPMSADTKRPIFAYFWSRDSKFILYAQDKGGDENFRIYAIDPAAKVDAETGVPPARDLTPYEKVAARIYAVPKKDPEHILIGLNDRDPRLHDVYRLNIRNGKRDLVRKNNENVVSWTFDLRGNLRLGYRQTNDGGAEILSVEGKRLKPVYACTFEETCQPIRFHRNGRQVYIETNKGNRDLIALALLDPKTGKEEFIESDPEGEVDFGGALFSEATDELVATAYIGDRQRMYPKRADFAANYEFLKKKFPDAEIRRVSITRDEKRILISVSSDVDPGSVYLFNPAEKSLDLLYRARPKLPTQVLSPRKPVRYTARDGVVVSAYLTLPKNVDPKNLAVVLVPHGGPWARTFWGYDPTAQFLVNRGYAVLEPNFRGSLGYGKKFLNLGNKQWGTGTMQHDLSDGVKWLIDQGIADPQRVAIMGGSYGGYATLAGLAFTPELYAAGVDIVGPSNIKTLLESIPPYWAPLKVVFHKRVGNPDDPQDAGMIRKQSPLFSAKQIRAPLLVIQGQNDPRVKRAESDQIVSAIRDLKLPVKYLVAPDEGHGYRGRENRLAMYTEVEAFLGEHLGGRHQEDVSDDIKKRLASLTVDIKTVQAPSAVAASDQGKAVMPTLEATGIKAGSMTYQQAMELGERKIEGTLTRTISQAQLENRPTWKIVDETTTQMGTAHDEIWLDAKTLLPLKRSVRQGPATVDLTVGEKEITGEIKMPGRQMPINSKLDGPTLLDGASMDLALGSLPLKAGYKASLRSFNAMMGKTQTWTAEVAGRESLALKSREVDAFKINLASPDAGSSAVVWVEASAPHRMLKSEANLTTQMGASKVTRVAE